MNFDVNTSRKEPKPRRLSEDSLPANKSWHSLAWWLQISVGEVLVMPLVADGRISSYHLRGCLSLGQFTNPMTLLSSGRVHIRVKENSHCCINQPLWESFRGGSTAQGSGEPSLSFLAWCHFVSPEKKLRTRATTKLKRTRNRPYQQKKFPFGKIGTQSMVIAVLLLVCLGEVGYCREESKSHLTFLCFAFQKFS